MAHDYELTPAPWYVEDGPNGWTLNARNPCGDGEDGWVADFGRCGQANAEFCAEARNAGSQSDYELALSFFRGRWFPHVGDGCAEPMAEDMALALAWVREKEREACAVLAEQQAKAIGWMKTQEALVMESQALRIAQAIRERGKQ